MHIDMKLNFMHILADLGFGGVYPIYWIKESKHAKTYTIVNMHAKTFKSQTRHNLDKTPSKPRRHTKVWPYKRLSKLYQRSKSTHDLRQRGINTRMIPKLNNPREEIPIETDSKEHMIEKVPNGK